jgi:hypothetical protein
MSKNNVYYLNNKHLFIIIIIIIIIIYYYLNNKPLRCQIQPNGSSTDSPAMFPHN